MKKVVPSQQGYAVLNVVLVLGVLITLLGITVSSASINSLQSGLAGTQGSYSTHTIQGCAELALLQLNTDNNLPSTITLPTGTCTVTLNSQVGSTWTFTITGEFKTHTKSMQVTAERTNTVSITSWNEV